MTMRAEAWYGRWLTSWIDVGPGKVVCRSRGNRGLEWRNVGDSLCFQGIVASRDSTRCCNRLVEASSCPDGLLIVPLWEHGVLACIPVARASHLVVPSSSTMNLRV